MYKKTQHNLKLSLIFKLFQSLSLIVQKTVYFNKTIKSVDSLRNKLLLLICLFVCNSAEENVRAKALNSLFFPEFLDISFCWKTFLQIFKKFGILFQHAKKDIKEL